MKLKDISIAELLSIGVAFFAYEFFSFSAFFTGRGPNSMVQDMIIRQKNQSELESLNGYFVKLADSLGIDIPYNKSF